MSVDGLDGDSAPVDDEIAARGIAERLLVHYRAHGRILPWRSPPGAPPPDPYRVWLSEIMLQQTGVRSVIPYFLSFTQRWPSVEALAAAPDDALMAAWAGLGYYARARNLLACARAVVRDHGGRFPGAEAELRALPGIGAYTAAAIAAIAFGRRAVVVDGNIERVVSRLFAVETALPAAKAELYALTDALTPDHHAGDFAQAMMDLGATICTPRSPDCGACPLAGDCLAYARGQMARFPVKAPKKARPLRQGVAWWVEAQGHVWLVRRPAKGLLGGMQALPGTAWQASAADPPAMLAPLADLPGHWRMADEVVRHVFTHFALDLSILCLRLPARPDAATLAKALGEGQWWPVAQIGQAGLPTLYARAVRAALAQPNQTTEEAS